tara:strand:+ start:265 stop:537 length:273 start_codon:yes stop_codon:yes gene_type:complete
MYHQDFLEVDLQEVCFQLHLQLLQFLQKMLLHHQSHRLHQFFDCKVPLQHLLHHQLMIYILLMTFHLQYQCLQEMLLDFLYYRQLHRLLL